MIRQALRPILPALSAEFGLVPADLEGMYLDEINEYVYQLDELHKHRKEALRKLEQARRGRH